MISLYQFFMFKNVWSCTHFFNISPCVIIVKWFLFANSLHNSIQSHNLWLFIIIIIKRFTQKKPPRNSQFVLNITPVKKTSNRIRIFFIIPKICETNFLLSIQVRWRFEIYYIYFMDSLLTLVDFQEFRSKVFKML